MFDIISILFVIFVSKGILRQIILIKFSENPKSVDAQIEIRDKSPTQINSTNVCPKEKSSKDKSPTGKSPTEKSPTDKSSTGKSPKDKSPTKKSSDSKLTKSIGVTNLPSMAIAEQHKTDKGKKRNFFFFFFGGGAVGCHFWLPLFSFSLICNS
jgi:hypothetical protein